MQSTQRQETQVGDEWTSWSDRTSNFKNQLAKTTRSTQDPIAQAEKYFSRSQYVRGIRLSLDWSNKNTRGLELRKTAIRLYPGRGSFGWPGRLEVCISRRFKNRGKDFKALVRWGAKTSTPVVGPPRRLALRACEAQGSNQGKKRQIGKVNCAPC